MLNKTPISILGIEQRRQIYWRQNAAQSMKPQVFRRLVQYRESDLSSARRIVADIIQERLRNLRTTSHAHHRRRLKEVTRLPLPHQNMTTLSTIHRRVLDYPIDVCDPPDLARITKGAPRCTGDIPILET